MRARTQRAHNPMWTTLSRMMPGADGAHDDVEIDRRAVRDSGIPDLELRTELEGELLADIDVHPVQPFPRQWVPSCSRRPGASDMVR